MKVGSQVFIITLSHFPEIFLRIKKKWDEEDLLFSFIEVDLKKYLGVAPNFNMSHQGTEAANKTEKF